MILCLPTLRLVKVAVAIPLLLVLALMVLPSTLKVTFLFLTILPLLFSSFAVNLTFLAFFFEMSLVTSKGLTVIFLETDKELQVAFMVYFPTLRAVVSRLTTPLLLVASSKVCLPNVILTTAPTAGVPLLSLMLIWNLSFEV